MQEWTDADQRVLWWIIEQTDRTLIALDDAAASLQHKLAQTAVTASGILAATGIASNALTATGPVQVCGLILLAVATLVGVAGWTGRTAYDLGSPEHWRAYLVNNRAQRTLQTYIEQTDGSVDKARQHNRQLAAVLTLANCLLSLGAIAAVFGMR